MFGRKALLLAVMAALAALGCTAAAMANALRKDDNDIKQTKLLPLLARSAFDPSFSGILVIACAHYSNSLFSCVVI